MKKRILIPTGLLATEIFITRLVYNYDQHNYVPTFSLENAVFFWGIIFFLLALAIMFGVENKYNISFPGSPNGGNYMVNVSNFIGNISQNFFSRFYDFSTGASILILGVINLIIYFVLII